MPKTNSPVDTAFDGATLSPPPWEGVDDFYLKHVTRERCRWSVAGVSRCGRVEAGEEWQAAGMLPVRASRHVRLSLFITPFRKYVISI